MRTIAVAHHKGGTAKTTTTVNLAAALAEAGHRVLVIDMDPQGSASAWLGVRDPEYSVVDAIRHGKDLAHLVYETTAPGVQLVPASPELIVPGPDDETDTALGFITAMERLAPLWDFVLVDCPPSLGYLGVAPLAACDEVLVPVEAHALAVAGLSSLMETIGRVGGRLNPKLKITGVLACRVDHTAHSRMVVERLARRFPKSFMRTKIRENVRLAEAPSFRAPITTFAPESTGAEDYRALAAEISAPAPARLAPVGASVKVTVKAPVAEPGPSIWSRVAHSTIRGRTWAQTISWLLPVAILVLAAFVRLWQLDAVGFNSDEAVYSGQAAALANDPDLTPFFPIFRAHPLLFQFALADVFALTGVDPLNARIVSAAAGILTVYVVYRLGRLLYDRPVGLIAAFLMALMPYHVIVTRQVLLDGPMTLFATLALYTVAKYAITGERTWLYASGAAMGLAFLSKETSVILLAAIFAFFALAPAIKVRIRDLALSVVVFVAVVAAFPLALVLAGAGGSSTAQQYLIWQLFRRPNHDELFYLQTVPTAVGPVLILAAIIGLWLFRRRLDWREVLLLAWIVVVVLFFELWPVKGFQYLLPAAPPLTILAARGLVGLSRLHLPRWIGDLRAGFVRRVARDRPGARAMLAADDPAQRLQTPRFGQPARLVLLTALVGVTMFAATWPRIQPASPSDTLAGAGGVPGGREAGKWIKENTPVGARLMTIGPSMANIIQFYGHRKAYGLSVSRNPLKRNPSYDALANPDLQVRSNQLQYVVWDSYSAARSGYFEAKLLDYVARYNGRVVHTETLPRTGWRRWVGCRRRVRGPRVIVRLLRGLAAGAMISWWAVSPVAAADPSPPVPTTPIQHAVFLMGDGRSFDSMFGTYPGADGIPADVCMPTDPTSTAGPCFPPLWVGDRTVPKFAQSNTVFATQYNAGKMDGFVRAQAAAGLEAPLVMGHYDERDVPFSWNVADAYVLFDKFFSSTTGGNLQNRMSWITGTTGTVEAAIPAAGFGDLPTIFDRLEGAGVDWKFYVQNYDRTVTFRNLQAMIDRPGQVERVPLLAFARFLDDPRLRDHIVDLSQYYRDLEQGTLPAVSYIAPAGGGASTPTAVRTSERLGQSIINALTRSTAWGSSMLLWTYDGWGGWYDHVAPPQVDPNSYGFRVPALLVSPFARRGYVDATPLDFTSMARFVTTNWGLQPMAAGDASARAFTEAFDFANAGRPPVFLDSTRDPGAGRTEPKRGIIFLAYGIALVAAVALIGIAALRTRRPPRRDQATKVIR